MFHNKRAVRAVTSDIYISENEILGFLENVYTNVENHCPACPTALLVKKLEKNIFFGEFI